MTAVPATQTYHLFIRATPERIWEALTRPELSAGYLFGALVDTTAEVGAPFRYHSPDRTALWGDDTVLDAEPPHRLVITYRGLYDPDLAAEPASRVRWQIEPDQNGACLLTVVHDRLERAPRTAERVAGTGWMRVLSGLKTLLETGEPLNSWPIRSGRGGRNRRSTASPRRSPWAASSGWRPRGRGGP